jgi:hypothetical protein
MICQDNHCHHPCLVVIWSTVQSTQDIHNFFSIIVIIIIIIPSSHQSQRQKWKPKSKENVSDHAREISFPGKEVLHVRWSIDRGATPIGAQPTARKPFSLLRGLAGLRSTLEHPGCSCNRFRCLSLDRHIMIRLALDNVGNNARKNSYQV